VLLWFWFDARTTSHNPICNFKRSSLRLFHFLCHFTYLVMYCWKPWKNVHERYRARNKIKQYTLYPKSPSSIWFKTTVKLQTPDHLETVVLTKTSGICRSEIWITNVTVCNFLQTSGNMLVRTFYGPELAGPEFSVSLQGCYEYGNQVWLFGVSL
jgi:hypothetical protein